MNELLNDISNSLNIIDNAKIISCHNDEYIIIFTPYQFVLLLLVELNGRVYVKEDSEYWNFKFKSSSEDISIKNPLNELYFIKKQILKQLSELNMYFDDKYLSSFLVTNQKTIFDKKPINHIYSKDVPEKIKSIIVHNLNKKIIDSNSLDNLYKNYTIYLKLS
ncbi:hypothetical protein KHQ81_15805 (plasmid) [Mycoplasmatota bacterium]|nr:hypothetical protein KHQ81_15805 [Mycoplasmatota bacterium]